MQRLGIKSIGEGGVCPSLPVLHFHIIMLHPLTVQFIQWQVAGSSIDLETAHIPPPLKERQDSATW